MIGSTFLVSLAEELSQKQRVRVVVKKPSVKFKRSPKRLVAVQKTPVRHQPFKPVFRKGTPKPVKPLQFFEEDDNNNETKLTTVVGDDPHDISVTLVDEEQKKTFVPFFYLGKCRREIFY